MGGFGHPVGGLHGLTHIGINYEVVPSGSRTSFPHAEKLEEEFVFVLAGKPDVRIDGQLHPLEAGDAVAFPAGTGWLGQGHGGGELATCLPSSLGRETLSATFSSGTKGVSNAYSKWLFKNHRFLSKLRENAVKISAASASPASSAASIPSRVDLLSAA